MRRLIAWGIDHPKLVIGFTALITLGFLVQFPGAVIDTDPENMLEADQPDRVFYAQAKEDFGIHDMIVVGVTDDEGVFQPKTLGQLARIAEGILGVDGVIVEDVMSFSTTDNVTSGGGILSVARIMDEPPTTDEDAAAMRAAVF